MRLTFATFALALIGTSAQATTFFDSSIPETLSSLLNDDVVVEQGTDLTIDANGVVKPQIASRG